MVRTKWTIIVLFAAMFALLGSVQGAEYFVTKQGSDTNNGTSKATAFLTIQKGVNTLSPGDTLTIGPGEYFESIKRDGLGSANVDTTIRAEIPRTALIRGDVAGPEFKKVEGRRFIYGAAFDRVPQAVFEHDTLSVLTKRPTMLDLEYEPGTFCYDEASKTLYISSTDMRSPENRHYTIAISDKHAIELTKPQRVIIEGVAACGFSAGWGLLLVDGPVSCTVRDCAWYLCEGGLQLDKGSGNIVENCESYGHSFGGIVRYRANNDIIRNCRTYDTKNAGGEHFGIMHYFDMPGTLLIKDNISWGQAFDYSVKPSQNELLENSIALGFVRNAKMSHDIIGGGNEYDRHSNEFTSDNILFLREKNLEKDFEFADYLNLDFRLQPDSRFRGTGPDGSDSGPYQYEPNVFYVSPNGDDAADGLSMRKPWQTLARAFKNLKPGDTVYLTAGEYVTASLSRLGNGKSPIRILGRGYGTVVITGKQSVTGSAGIVFERLNFVDGASLSDSRDVSVKNCTLSADGLAADKIASLKVTHCVFADAPLNVTNSDTVTLSGNVYANDGKPAVRLDAADGILYSDYNDYQDTAQCWQVGGATWSFADLQKQHDRYSQTLAPELVMAQGVPSLANDTAFKTMGPLSKALGINRDYDATPGTLALVGPMLHSVSDTTANIEWWTSKPATFDLVWGDTPEMTNKVENIKAPDCFTTYSLTGLKPGQTYYFKLVSGSASLPDASLVTLETKDAALSFTTAAEAIAPRTYYVAMDGKDTNTGIDRGQAFRTVNHAADVVNAGDTVLIAGGTYHELTRVRATGDEGRPITFKCIPGEKVVFEGANLAQAFKVVVKKNIRFDGFYFENFGNSMAGVFVLWHADGTQITRCLNVRGTGNISLVEAEYSSDLLVKNCVTAGGFSGIQLNICPRFRLENNLVLRPLIAAVSFVNEPEDKGYFTKNIFTDDLPYKVNGPLFEIGRVESLVDKDNCYFLRRPDEQRKMFMFYGKAAYERYVPDYGVSTDYKTPPIFNDKPDGTEDNPRLSLKDYQDLVGDTGSFVGDPKFAGNEGVAPGGKLWTGDPSTMFDKLLRDDLDFPGAFATDPKAVEKGVGPQPEAFEDFWFNKK